MSDSNRSDSNGGRGGRAPKTEMQPSGLTARQERILARRVVRATMRLSGAGDRASKSLDRCVELIEKGMEGDVSLTEARRTADTLVMLTEKAAPKDAPVEGGQHVHIHAAELSPDALEAALGHMADARKGPRLHDGNGDG